MSDSTSPRSRRMVESPVDAILPQYVNYLRAQRYADDTIQRYRASLVHFTHRLDKGLTLADIKQLVAGFPMGLNFNWLRVLTLIS